MKINRMRIAVAGLAVGMAGNLWGLLTCRWLFKWVYEVCQPQIYRPEMLDGTFGWMLSMGASKVALGIFMVLAYAVAGQRLPGRGVRRGVWFGGLIWLLGLLPSKWSAFMSLTLPVETFLYWVANDLVASVLLGVLTVLLYEKAWGGLDRHVRGESAAGLQAQVVKSAVD